MNDFTFDLSHDLLDNLANLSFNDDFNSEINTLLEKTEKFEEKKNSSGERTRGNSCSPALIRYQQITNLKLTTNSLIKINNRTDSITGRPEEFYKTVKKKNLKGTTIVVGDYVSQFFSIKKHEKKLIKQSNSNLGIDLEKVLLELFIKHLIQNLGNL